jgi:hypothetical protein
MLGRHAVPCGVNGRGRRFWIGRAAMNVPAVLLQGGDAMELAPALEAHHAGSVLGVLADVAHHVRVFPVEGTSPMGPARPSAMPDCDGSLCQARMREGPSLAAGQIPTLWIDSAEHRRNRRKQKVNKLSQGAVLHVFPSSRLVMSTQQSRGPARSLALASGMTGKGVNLVHCHRILRRRGLIALRPCRNSVGRS